MLTEATSLSFFSATAQQLASHRSIAAQSFAKSISEYIMLGFALTNKQKKWCAENVKQSFPGARALTFGRTAAAMLVLDVTGGALWLEILP